MTECICNCDRDEPEEPLKMIEGDLYVLRDGRIGRYLAESRKEFMFKTSVRTGFYSTKQLEGIKHLSGERS